MGLELKWVFFVFTLFLLNVVSYGQFGEPIYIDERVNGKPLYEVLEKNDVIENFFIEDRKLLNKEISGVSKKTTLLSYLRELYPGKFFHLYGKKNILVLETPPPKSSSMVMLSKGTKLLKGEIIDNINREKIFGASVYIPLESKGTISDLDGQFKVTITHNIVRIQFSYTGFQQEEKILIFGADNNNSFVNIVLQNDPNYLETVNVVAEKSTSKITSKLMGVENLSVKMVKQLPTFLGEVDPLKGVATLPGVSSTGDLATGFNVRGGTSSQNLILLDGSVIFNPTHLFGFFSVFNPDFLGKIVLLKGGGTPEYGGRASSVLNIQTRNGDSNNYKISGGVGLVASRLSVEGPIKKGKSSFLVGGRLSYGSWLVRLYEDEQLQKSKANFNDVSIKLFQELNKKNYISLSTYHSKDDFNLGIDSTFAWNTNNFSIKWDHLYSEKSYSSITLSNSDYKSKVLNEDKVKGFIYSNGVNVTNLNYLYNHDYSDDVQFAVGGKVSYNQLAVGELVATSKQSVSSEKKLNTQKAIDGAMFLNMDYEIKSRWAFNLGVRYSWFTRLGPDKVYLLDYSMIDSRKPKKIGEKDYNNNDFFSFYNGVEPRLAFRYLMMSKTSIKGSYYVNRQYLHQISTTISPSPVDFWMASSPNIKPIKSTQYSLGIFHSFKENTYELSLEGFWKKTDNMIDYIAGEDLFLNPEIEASILQGKGRAYGGEFLVKKNNKKFSGWISYTYSRSFLKFDSSVPELKINEGEFYSSVFDMPHQLSIVSNYRIKEQITLSVNFTYNSGQPITVPVSQYSYYNVLAVHNYSNRNQFRTEPYHRLDLSLIIYGKKRANGAYSDKWVFSLYNLYNRKNPYAIFFDKWGGAYKTTVIGSVVPSISYQFKFNPSYE